MTGYNPSLHLSQGSVKISDHQVTMTASAMLRSPWPGPESSWGSALLPQIIPLQLSRQTRHGDLPSPPAHHALLCPGRGHRHHHGRTGGPALPQGRPHRAQGEDPRLPPRPLHSGQLHPASSSDHAGAGEQVSDGRLRTGRGHLRRHEEEEGGGQGRRRVAERPVQVQQQGHRPSQWALQHHPQPQQQAELRQLHPEEGEVEAEDTAGVAEVHQVEDPEEEEEEAEEKDHEDSQQETEEPIRTHWTVGEEDQGGGQGVQPEEEAPEEEDKAEAEAEAEDEAREEDPGESLTAGAEAEDEEPSEWEEVGQEE